ncbi:MAG: tyrosine-type recombinase/integrase [Gammaproteobacteria bacterium]|nr:tyrosine-type recombinase/integrase [Gammaproteobacteria bacterium]
MALTDAKVRAAKWDGKDYYLNDGNGLYLYVRKASKRWIIRRKRSGRMRVTSLGKYPDIGIKEARSTAAVTDKKRHPSAVLVSELVEEYRAIVERDNKRPHLTTGYLSRGLPATLLKTRVADVARTDLVVAIKDYPIRNAGHSGERARDAFRGVLKQLFGLAVELGYRDDNPADQITSRVTGYQQVDRARVLSDNEIKLLWHDVHPNASVLRFLLLTGVRSGEMWAGAPWATDGRMWHVPGEISKNGDAHWVYLTDSAKAELAQGGPGNSMTAVQSWTRRWCERHGVEARFTPHDLRRTVSTRLNDAGVEPYVVEKLLNHRMQGVMAVYNRAEYAEQRIKAYELLERLLLEAAK